MTTPKTVVHTESPTTHDHEYFDGEIANLSPLAAAWQELTSHPGEETLRTVLRQMNDVVVLIDRETRVLEASESAMSRLGIPLGQRLSKMDFGLVRDTSGERIVSDDAIYFRCLRGETIENTLCEFVRPDGQSKYFIINATPIRNGAGEVAVGLLVAREITEITRLQHRTEKMLLEMSRQRTSLKHLINHLPASVILLDSELRVLGANKTYSEYFGPEPNWRLGGKLVDLLPLAEEAGILNMLRRALKTGRPVRVREFRYDGFAKGPTYWSGSAVPVELPLDEGPVAAVAMVTVDVTPEYRARERLVELAALAERRAREIESEKTRLTTIIESTPVPLLVYDTERRVVARNEAAEKLLSTLGREVGVFSAFDVGAEHGLILRTEADELLEGTETPYMKSLRGEVVTDLIVECHTGSGPRRVLSLNAAPLRDAKGEITGVVEAILDITEKTRAQEQIHENYKREHAIADKLQNCFLPTELPGIGGFEIGKRYRPAWDEALVGGDFYDVFRLSETKYGVVMADAAGKGLEAAVYTAMTKYMLRAYALEDSAPERVMERLNEALATCTPIEVFVTLVYAVVDSSDRTVVYANAGHEHPLLLMPRHEAVTTLDVTGRALGLTKRSTYTAQAIQMLPGDTLLLYTDGITDAGRRADRFGQERLAELLRQGGGYQAQELADSILGHAMEFNGELRDDAALLIIRAEGREQI